MPTCQPRDTIVKLPLPDDASVDEVIPSHVVVKRCSGVCHEGNVYHQCVPKSGARTDQGCQVYSGTYSHTSKSIFRHHCI